MKQFDLFGNEIKECENILELEKKMIIKLKPYLNIKNNETQRPSNTTLLR